MNELIGYSAIFARIREMEEKTSAQQQLPEEFSSFLSRRCATRSDSATVDVVKFTNYYGAHLIDQATNQAFGKQSSYIRTVVHFFRNTTYCCNR